MRTKFLSIITCFLLVSFAMSACLDSDETYEYSSDATVHYFSLDTIHGVDYRFTIDQLEKVIYNRDSMPVGADTILDRIIVDTMTVTGWVTTQDTLFSTGDSVDLRGAINSNEGLKFKIYAADGLSTSTYTLKINVHNQIPDSLVWRDMQEVGEVFSTTANANAQRAVLWNDPNNGVEYLLVFASNTTLYKSSTELSAYVWTTETISGMPAEADLTSLINFREALYVLAEGDVYTSIDATTWEKSESLSGNVQALLAVFPENSINGNATTLAAIQQDGEEKYFCTTTDPTVEWTRGEVVEDDFPITNLSYTALITATGVNKVVLVGTPEEDLDVTTPWFSMDGKGWASLETTSYDTYCPVRKNPTIIYYGGYFYMFGGEFDAIYYSVTGIAWFKTDKLFLLPDTFREYGSSYSLVVDKNNYIWIIWGGHDTENRVWRGRLNRFGFAIQ